MAARKPRTAKELDRIWDGWEVYAEKQGLYWSPVRGLLLHTLFRTRTWMTAKGLRARARRRYDRLGHATTTRCLNHLVAAGVVERKLAYPGGIRVYRVVVPRRAKK